MADMRTPAGSPEGAARITPGAVSAWDRGWPVALVVLSVAYLLAEFVFNAALLNAASSVDQGSNAIDRVELFGRTLSGTGFALLLVGFAYRHLRRMSLILVLGAVGWAGMFWGQKALIDYAFVDDSTWEQRLAAQEMSLLKVGLARNVVRIEGAPFDPNAGASPQERTFLALVGGLVMNSPGFLAHVRDQQDAIVGQIARRTGQDKLAEEYPRYLEAGEQFEGEYRTYAEASERYDRAVRTAGREASRRWSEVYDQLGKGWERYRAGVKRFNARLVDDFPGLSSSLKRYYEARARCRSRSCMQRLDKRYHSEMGKHFGSGAGSVSTDYWCQELRDPGVEAGNLIGGLVGAVSDGINALAGGHTNYAERSQHRLYSCPVQNRDFMLPRMRALSEERFKRESGGYPYGIRDRLAFIDHPASARRLIDELRQEGITLPRGWTTRDAEAFKSALVRHVRTKARRRWDAEITRLAGDVVEPKLSYKRFIADDVIQERIRQRMGDQYINGLDFEMSEAEFKRRVIEPATKHAIELEVRQLTEGARDFANGKPREEEGKSYMRAVIVPPIALFFSLFFGLLTLGKTGYAMLAMVMDSRPVATRVPRQASRAIKGAVLACVMALLLLTPFFTTNKFVSSSAFGYFMATAEAESSTAERLFSQYAMRIQPLVYPAGKALASLFAQAMSSVETLGARAAGGRELGADLRRWWGFSAEPSSCPREGAQPLRLVRVQVFMAAHDGRMRERAGVVPEISVPRPAPVSRVVCDSIDWARRGIRTARAPFENSG